MIFFLQQPKVNKKAWKSKLFFNFFEDFWATCQIRTDVSEEPGYKAGGVDHCPKVAYVSKNLFLFFNNLKIRRILEF